MNTNSVITITLGDMAENHVGMQQIGQIVEPGQGFNITDLMLIKQTFDNFYIQTELIDLSNKELNNINPDIILPSAYILIIKNGIDFILNVESNYNINQMFEEQSNLNVDKLALMYGRVVNKKARWNLCFDDVSSEPDYINGKGRIISWNEIPITKTIYDKLSIYFGPKAQFLKAEANYYYNPFICGIGYHGDTERRKVIGLRLGNQMPLYYQWYYQNNPIGNRMSFNLSNGDIYIMSEKTVGTDWKKKNIYTLRHATGCDQYTTV